MNAIDMMRAIRQELSVTGEDITIDHSSPEAHEESRKKFGEFKELAVRIGELARPKRS